MSDSCSSSEKSLSLRVGDNGSDIDDWCDMSPSPRDASTNSSAPHIELVPWPDIDNISCMGSDTPLANSGKKININIL